jgi:3-vinyl bacteriochlorophyllide hydratase
MTVVHPTSERHPLPGAAGASSTQAIGAPAAASAATRSIDDASAGPSGAPAAAGTRRGRVKKPLYTPEQRKRRDETKWTLVQGILAPLQLLAMLISVVLVLRYLKTGEGLLAANVSVVVKTMFLYVIMITGAIWEKVVFDQYLFHEAFFWEDVVSFGVIAVHTAYLWGLFAGWDPRVNLTIALVAYVIYTVNAIQFLLKLRAARLLEAEMAAAERARAAVAAPAMELAS